MIILLNTPLTVIALKRMFDYYAPYYNLSDYDRISAGCAETLFNWFQMELTLE